MAAKTVFTEGAVYEFAYPFVRVEASTWDDEGPSTFMSWRPGAIVGPEDCQGYATSKADGTGKQIVTVISTHKPGRYPQRVFYLRAWMTPDGKKFGKPRLMIKTLTAFKTLIAGYRYEFEVEPDPLVTRPTSA